MEVNSWESVVCPICAAARAWAMALAANLERVWLAVDDDEVVVSVTEVVALEELLPTATVLYSIDQ